MSSSTHSSNQSSNHSTGQSSLQSSLHSSEMNSINASIEALREEMFDHFATIDSPEYAYKERVYRSKEQQIQRFQEKITYLLQAPHSENEEVVTNFSCHALMDMNKHADILAWINHESTERSAKISPAAAAAQEMRWVLGGHLNVALNYYEFLLAQKEELLSGDNFEELCEVNDECIYMHKLVAKIEADIKTWS